MDAQSAVFSELEKAYCDLLMEWRFFQGLYGDELAHRNRFLLNQFSPTFFSMVFRLLHSSVVVSLSKMTDPAITKIKGVDHKNVSFHGAIEELGDIDMSDKNRLGNLLDQISALAANYRLHRNKRLGHNDLNTSLRINELPKLDYVGFNDLVDKCGGLLNEIAKVRGYESTNYSSLLSSNNGPEALLRNLSKITVQPL